MRGSYCLILSFMVLQPTVAQRDATESTAVKWEFPAQDTLTVNYIDTVVLQWTSIYEEPWMNMWCQNETTGKDTFLGSQFQVPSNGSFPYIISEHNTSELDYPFICHAWLSKEADEKGEETPFAITFTSRLQVAAETFSLSGNVTSDLTSTSSTLATSTQTSSTSTSTTEPEQSSSSTSGSVKSSSAISTAAPPPAITSQPSSISSPSSSSAIAASATNADIPKPSSLPGGMSIAATAGVGVASAAGLVMIAGLVSWLVRRRRAVNGKRNTALYGEDKLGDHGSEDDVARKSYEIAANERRFNLESVKRSTMRHEIS